jgi:hypothetical protein
MRRISSQIGIFGSILVLTGISPMRTPSVTPSSGSLGVASAGERAVPQVSRAAGRSFLVAGSTETPGFRAYSYVLLAPPTEPANQASNEATLAAFLGIDEVTHLQGPGAEAQSLNIVYLPVLEAPTSNVTSTWLLAHFDYDRARSILAAIGVAEQHKPLLVSYTSPISSRTIIDQNELLVQNLSAGPSALTSSLGKQLSPASPDGKTRGEQRLTGRAFLPTGKPEGSGYGLYSYVLFGEPLNPGNRELYRAVVSAFLTIQEVRRFEEAGEQRSKLNVTYLPLQDLPPAGAGADWLLDHYDFARAQILLSKVMDRMPGPYILSYSSPLSSAPSVEKSRLLVEDLSGVTPDLAFLWVNEFTAQAGRPQYWDKPALRNLMLNLRTQVAVAAQALEEVQTANSKLRAVFESKIKIQE